MGKGHSCLRRKKRSFTITEVDLRESKQVQLDDFQILRAIGKGSFGKVCIVQKKDSRKLFAMKYVNKDQCAERDAFRNVLREIEILSLLDHPFIVNLWFTFQKSKLTMGCNLGRTVAVQTTEYYEVENTCKIFKYPRSFMSSSRAKLDEEDMFMVVDLLLGGDLRYHMQQNTSDISQERVLLYICEIALALDYLRTKNILHRDIKPENILIDDTGHLHLTDFNIAAIVIEKETLKSVTGTKPYMAPEILQCAYDHTNGYSFPADWWSLGVVAYELLCNMRPYPVNSSAGFQETHDLICNSCLRFPKKVNRDTVDLILKLLTVNPEERISSVQQMRLHNALESIDFNAVYNKQYTPSFVPIKNQLNCDPTFELEEMIIESKPLHKKKKRLSKRNKTRSVLQTQASKDEELAQVYLNNMQDEFIMYNRENLLANKKKIAEKKSLEEDLANILK